MLATTSASTDLCISVTSSGLSSISKTITCTSGLFLIIDCARFCKSNVLPALGGDTIKPLCPFPIGATRSIILGEMSWELPEPVSSFSLESGNKGVKFSKAILS